MFLLISGHIHNVWIVGHSFVFWAKHRADRRNYGSNLNLEFDAFKVLWFGHKGMLWRMFCDSLSSLHEKWPLPRDIILHLSGNDIGKCNTLQLLAHMKLDLQCLHAVLPQTILVFSEIIPRKVWLISSEFHCFEKICKRVNRAMSKFIPSVAGFSFRHIDLEGGLAGFYREDNVHLSDIALDIFNLDMQTCVELAVARGVCQAL